MRGKFFEANSNNNGNNNRINLHLTRDMQPFPIVEEPQVEVGNQLSFFRRRNGHECGFFFILECEKYSTACFIGDYG